MIPRWMRVLLACDAAAQRLARGTTAIRDEVLLTCVAPDHRDAVTAAIYERNSTYAPGGPMHGAGLFEWERRAIEAFPSRGRVLVGAAGGGREVAALDALGYDVFAFDPCASLVARGRAALSRNEHVMFCVGSYADLVHAVENGKGPLARIAAGAPFDAIVLGWASLSHVRRSTDRRALLESLRRLSPAGPVLASWAALAPPDEQDDPSGARLWARRLLEGLGSRRQAEPGEVFWPHAGFLVVLDTQAIRAEIEAAGYRIEWLREVPVPHALLRPGVSPPFFVLPG